jgi:hypothetical protein
MSTAINTAQRTLTGRLFIVVLVLSLEVLAKASPSKKDIGELYDRLATDLKVGKPLVATVYVALCDNDSQGIVPVRNRNICMGDVPERNLYWATSGGLKAHAQTRRWKRVLYEKHPNELLAARAVWKKGIPPGGALRARGVPGPIDVYLVGLAYRGVKIRTAMVDYLKAVRRDHGEELALPNGKKITYQGKSHVLGFIGHDYFMDEPNIPGLLKETAGNGHLAKGVFGLACMSDDFFRPAIERRNTHILVLNKQLAYPSAFTALGVLRAIAAGQNHKGIHREAARAFAKGQNKSVGTMLRALSYGDVPRDR